MLHSGLVSIITPSYNSAKYITDTISCVLKQTYTNWEMLIVDDCSTDDIDRALKPFIVDKRIRYFKHEVNKGTAEARNWALREARGQWIAFLDSDDIWEPTKLEKQIMYMKENDLHFSYTCYDKIDEEGKPLGIYNNGPKYISKRKMIYYDWIGCLTVMYDTSIIGLIQIPNLKLRNDYALWLKAIKKTDCYLLDECLAHYRVRKDSISHIGYINLLKHHFILFKQSEGMSFLGALFCTVLNMVFGVYKKMKYERKINIFIPLR